MKLNPRISGRRWDPLASCVFRRSAKFRIDAAIAQHHPTHEHMEPIPRIK